MDKQINQPTTGEDEGGFTLIELMVVVLIIGILMAIAIPTFLGAKGNANARAAESNLRNAVTAQQTYYTQSATQVYGNAAAVSSLEPALNFQALTTGMPTVKNAVYVVDPSGSQNVLMGSVGNDGKYYWVYDANGTVSYEIQPSTATAQPSAPTTTATGNASSTASTWETAW